MLDSKEFDNMEKAAEYIKKILAELPVSDPCDFDVIHSITQTQVNQDAGEWSKISDMLLDFLRDLDAQEGSMILEKNGSDHCWDFVEAEWGEDRSFETYDDINEVFVEAGEGVVVLYNHDAVNDEDFPIVVLKKRFWERMKWRATALLRKREEGKDYTGRVSPAIYIQLFIYAQA